MLDTLIDQIQLGELWFSGPTHYRSRVPTGPGFLAIVVLNDKKAWNLVHLMGGPNLQRETLNSTSDALWMTLSFALNPEGNGYYSFAWLPTRAWKRPKPALHATIPQQIKAAAEIFFSNLAEDELLGDTLPF